MSEIKLDEIEMSVFMCVDADTITDEQLAKCAEAMENNMEKYLGQSRRISIRTYRDNE